MPKCGKTKGLAETNTVFSSDSITMNLPDAHVCLSVLGWSTFAQKSNSLHLRYPWQLHRLYLECIFEMLCWWGPCVCSENRLRLWCPVRVKCISKQADTSWDGSAVFWTDPRKTTAHLQSPHDNCNTRLRDQGDPRCIPGISHIFVLIV